MGYRKRRYQKQWGGRRSSRSREDADAAEEGFFEALGEWIAESFHRLMLILTGRRRTSTKPASPRAFPPASAASSSRPDLPPLRKRSRADLVALTPHVPGTTGLSPAAPHDEIPYRRSQGLLTKGERAFWQPLYQAVKGKYRIFCKVRLADVVYCPEAHRHERRWFRKIGRYHVDFVLCDPTTTAPVLVIELDDRRHREAARRERDAFKDQVLRAAGLPVYRVRAQQAYEPAELTREIARRMKMVSDASS